MIDSEMCHWISDMLRKNRKLRLPTFSRKPEARAGNVVNHKGGKPRHFGQLRHEESAKGCQRLHL